MGETGAKRMEWGACLHSQLGGNMERQKNGKRAILPLTKGSKFKCQIETINENKQTKCSTIKMTQENETKPIGVFRKFKRSLAEKIYMYTPIRRCKDLSLKHKIYSWIGHEVSLSIPFICVDAKVTNYRYFHFREKPKAIRQPMRPIGRTIACIFHLANNHNIYQHHN